MKRQDGPAAFARKHFGWSFRKKKPAPPTEEELRRREQAWREDAAQRLAELRAMARSNAPEQPDGDTLPP